MLKKYFLLVSLMIGITVEARDLNCGGLCDSLKLYKKEFGEGHAGHLWEHTVWVTKAMARLFATDSKWIAGIDKKYERLMELVAFTHDVGKAGDCQFVHMSKPAHPITGVQYLLGKQPFYKDTTKECLDFQAWFAENELSVEDQKMLIVLAGMHQEFGVALTRILKKPEQQWIAFGVYLEKFINYCKQADYNNGYPNEQIVRMAIALTVADIQGMFPVDFACKHLPELQDEPQTLFNALPYFDSHVIDTQGYTVAQELITYCCDRVVVILSKKSYAELYF